MVVPPHPCLPLGASPLASRGAASALKQRVPTACSAPTETSSLSQSLDSQVLLPPAADEIEKHSNSIMVQHSAAALWLCCPDGDRNTTVIWPLNRVAWLLRPNHRSRSKSMDARLTEQIDVGSGLKMTAATTQCMQQEGSGILESWHAISQDVFDSYLRIRKVCSLRNDRSNQTGSVRC